MGSNSTYLAKIYIPAALAPCPQVQSLSAYLLDSEASFALPRAYKESWNQFLLDRHVLTAVACTTRA